MGKVIFRDVVLKLSLNKNDSDRNRLYRFLEEKNILLKSSQVKEAKEA